jgi:hypothetical protein
MVMIVMYQLIGHGRISSASRGVLNDLRSGQRIAGDDAPTPTAALLDVYNRAKAASSSIALAGGTAEALPEESGASAHSTYVFISRAGATESDADHATPRSDVSFDAANYAGMITVSIT